MFLNNNNIVDVFNHRHHRTVRERERERETESEMEREHQAFSWDRRALGTGPILRVAKGVRARERATLVRFTIVGMVHCWLWGRCYRRVSA